MAVCSWCDREMRVAMSCSVGALHLDGKRVDMIPWGRSGRHEREKCHDCGVAPGGFHHLGCDMQRCPLCRRQMMSCGCRFDEDGPEEDDLEPPDPLHVDEDGTLVEVRVIGGQEFLVRYVDELPEKDRSVVDGIPCTTALRTVIDLAADPAIDEAGLDRIVNQFLDRGLFTVAEARARIAEPDMCRRRGAALVGGALDRRQSTGLA